MREKNWDDDRYDKLRYGAFEKITTDVGGKPEDVVLLMDKKTGEKPGILRNQPEKN